MRGGVGMGMEGGEEEGVWVLEGAEEWSTHGWWTGGVAGGF